MIDKSKWYRIAEREDSPSPAPLEPGWEYLVHPDDASQYGGE